MTVHASDSSCYTIRTEALPATFRKGTNEAITLRMNGHSVRHFISKFKSYNLKHTYNKNHNTKPKIIATTITLHIILY